MPRTKNDKNHKHLVILATFILALFLANKYLQNPTMSALNVLVEIKGQILPSSGGGGGGSPAEESLLAGVFSDSECKTTLTDLDWGSLFAGESTTRTFYIKNTGDSSFSMNISATNWNPIEAEEYLQLTWNHDNKTVLSSLNVVPVAFTLYVSPLVSGITSYSFDIIVTAIKKN